jgi:hypothetical protein
MLQDEPQRTKERIDSALPMFMESNKDIMDPRRTCP